MEDTRCQSEVISRDIFTGKIVEPSVMVCSECGHRITIRCARLAYNCPKCGELMFHDRHQQTLF
jgi:predicted RNA-binding Zn-ribbon protein involved in translation (DUF1610 family)